MDEEMTTVTGDIDDFESIFKGAPPFPIELTFTEIGTMLLAFELAGYYMLMTGDPNIDEIMSHLQSIKDKSQSSLQKYIDEHKPSEQHNEEV